MAPQDIRQNTKEYRDMMQMKINIQTGATADIIFSHVIDIIRLYSISQIYCTNVGTTSQQG